MNTFEFPTVEFALALHKRLLQEFCGQEGVLNMGALESALGSAQNGYYQDVYEVAAALMR